MKRTLLTLAAIPLLAFSLTLSGCTFNPSQFEQVLNEVAPAVATILQIVVLVSGHPMNSNLSTKIASDVADTEKLYADLQTAVDANKSSIVSQINASFNALENDLGTVFALSQVKDSATQIKLTALIGLISSAIQIAEAAVPGLTVQRQLNPIRIAPLKLTPDGFVSSYNKILTAKTGNEQVDAFTPKHTLHRHAKTVRVLTFGLAN